MCCNNKINIVRNSKNSMEIIPAEDYEISYFKYKVELNKK